MATTLPHHSFIEEKNRTCKFQQTFIAAVTNQIGDSFVWFGLNQFVQEFK